MKILAISIRFFLNVRLNWSNMDSFVKIIRFGELVLPFQWGKMRALWITNDYWLVNSMTVPTTFTTSFVSSLWLHLETTSTHALISLLICLIILLKLPNFKTHFCNFPLMCFFISFPSMNIWIRLAWSLYILHPFARCSRYSKSWHPCTSAYVSFSTIDQFNLALINHPPGHANSSWSCSQIHFAFDVENAKSNRLFLVELSKVYR